MLICSIFIVMKISNSMANNKEDMVLIDKANEEINYIEGKLEENVYYIKAQDWLNISKNINLIYSYWNVVILDLNELEVKSSYLSEFGKRLDEFTIAVEEKSVNVQEQKPANYIIIY